MDWILLVIWAIGIAAVPGAYILGRLHGSRARQRAYMAERTTAPARFVRREFAPKPTAGPSPKFARERREATEAHISQPRPEWDQEA